MSRRSDPGMGDRRGLGHPWRGRPGGQWIEPLQGSRITAAHVKDIAPAGENADEDGWADVGHGTMVDWPAIMARPARRRHVKHFVMEHDNPKDHARFAKRAIASAARF
jgi:sugar phosphate isomerase/epimerase